MTIFDGLNPPVDGLYPPVPSGFVWEPFSEFYPMILMVAAATAVFVAIFGRRHSYFDKIILGYLFISMLIHFNLERYYVHWNHKILDPDNQHLMARVWRHYGVSDTRWHGQQPGVPLSQYSCMYGLEYLAAYLCGPTVSLTILLYIFRSPWRWPIQCVAVTAQCYGLLITWLPAYYENLASVPVQDQVMFYGYFIGWQAPWAIIPFLMVLQAGWHVSKAFKYMREYHYKSV